MREWAFRPELTVEAATTCNNALRDVAKPLGQKPLHQLHKRTINNPHT
jgi:hypothetical protein